MMIWNMAPVLKEEDEKNENIPKMLCQMDNHLGNLLSCFFFFVFFFIDIHMTKELITALGDHFSADKIVYRFRLLCVSSV